MTKAHCTTSHSAHTPLAMQAAQAILAAGRFVIRLPLTVFEVLLVWQDRATERAALRQLADSQLKDMGLDRAEVSREASIPFWRAS
jgi:uncharacterized protein YjiS (DUF1127 family)